MLIPYGTTTAVERDHDRGKTTKLANAWAAKSSISRHGTSVLRHSGLTVVRVGGSSSGAGAADTEEQTQSRHSLSSEKTIRPHIAEHCIADRTEIRQLDKEFLRR